MPSFFSGLDGGSHCLLGTGFAERSEGLYRGSSRIYYRPVEIHFQFCSSGQAQHAHVLPPLAFKACLQKSHSRSILTSVSYCLLFFGSGCLAYNQHYICLSVPIWKIGRVLELTTVLATKFSYQALLRLPPSPSFRYCKL